MVLSGATEKSPVTPPGIDPGAFRLVAQCFNHYATPGPLYFMKAGKKFFITQPKLISKEGLALCS
jgi:hypothetical protein